MGATITDADESCIAVALITDNQRIMIEKYGEGEQNRDIIKAAYDADGATNTGYKMFYWGTYGTDVASIDNIVEESETLSDFNGKVKTHAIINTPDTDSYTTYANMGTYCVKFNEMNGGYNDWYIPAAGQMREINKNISDINQLLERIGGTKFSRGFYDYYWSTTEGNLYMAWFECFYGLDGGIYDKNAGYRVRFVRDID